MKHKRDNLLKNLLTINLINKKTLYNKINFKSNNTKFNHNIQIAI